MSAEADGWQDEAHVRDVRDGLARDMREQREKTGLRPVPRERIVRELDDAMADAERAAREHRERR